MKTATRLDIQGMRAVAVILVVLFHLPAALSLRGGFVGVDMFYVISGFVVTNMVVGAQSPGGTFRAIGAFLRRRVMRLAPALAAVVIATMLLALLFAPTRELGSVARAGLTSEFFVSNFFYARDFDTYWAPEVLRSPFLHTWSLGVEFQVYLLFPLVFLAVFAAGRATQRALKSALVVTLVLASVSFVAFVWLLEAPTTSVFGYDPQALAFYTPVTRFWEFAAGIVPAILARNGLPVSRPLSRVLVVSGWLLIAAGVVGSAIADTLNLSVVAACTGVALLIVAGMGSEAPSSLLAWKPLVWIGDRSYSIYLWHWPLLVLSLWLFPGSLIVAVGSLVLTLGLSMLTYRFVEQRFRRSAVPRRALVPSAVFVIAGAVLASAGIGVAAAPWYATPVALSAVATSFDDSGVTGSDVVDSVAPCTTEELQITCINYPDAQTVVVIGDSLGYRSMPAVQLAAQQHGLNATMMWTGGCGIELDSCPPFVYEYLAKTDVVAVVIAMNFDRASDRLNATESAVGVVPACLPGTPLLECPAHLAAVREFELKATPGLLALESYTDNILMALPFPQQQQFVATCLSVPIAQRLFASPVDPITCGRTSLEWESGRQGNYPRAIRAATADDKHVTLWDPTLFLCADGWCPAVINGGEQIMQDGIHWSPEASRFLYPEFRSYFDTLTP